MSGFWSITLYNNEHFFHPNSQKPYSRGTKNRNLRKGADGSLTLYVATKSPGADKESNWLRHYSARKFSNDGQTISPRTDHRQLGISLGVTETRMEDKVGGALECSDGIRGECGIEFGATSR